MTSLSRQPWSARLNSDGTTALLSADGRTVATFKDYRDAEDVISAACDFHGGTVDTLQSKIDQARWEMEDARASILGVNIKPLSEEDAERLSVARSAINDALETLLKRA